MQRIPSAHTSPLSEHGYETPYSYTRSGVQIIEIKYVRLFSFGGVRALATTSEIGCFLQLAHDYWITFLRTATVHNVFYRLVMVSDL